MKTYLSLLILLFAIACKKEQPATKPVEFKTTSYDFLGTFDDKGRPNYLATGDNISQETITYLQNTLPEFTDLRTSHPDLLSSSAIADIPVTQNSDIYITFVTEVTKYKDALAFYTYPTNSPPASAKDIVKITYIFPNAGNGSALKAGDKVKIGTFTPGTSIGFVLMQDAWDDTNKKLNNNAVHFCSNDVLNPEVDPKLKKHAVLINYDAGADHKVLIGFEDVDRTSPDCDQDFNDVVVYATVAHL